MEWTDCATNVAVIAFGELYLVCYVCEHMLMLRIDQSVSIWGCCPVRSQLVDRSLHRDGPE